MKSAKEWCQQYEDTDLLLGDLIPMIQADALRHVAKTVNDIGLGYSNPNSRNVCGMIAESLLTDATKLEKP